jgi:hypothetical protein
VEGWRRRRRRGEEGKGQGGRVHVAQGERPIDDNEEKGRDLHCKENEWIFIPGGDDVAVALPYLLVVWGGGVETQSISIGKLNGGQRKNKITQLRISDDMWCRDEKQMQLLARYFFRDQFSKDADVT